MRIFHQAIITYILENTKRVVAEVVVEVAAKTGKRKAVVVVVGRDLGLEKRGKRVKEVAGVAPAVDDIAGTLFKYTFRDTCTTIQYSLYTL